MSVTALDLSVVTIESLVSRDISAYSLRRARGAAVQAPAQPVPAAPAESAAARSHALPVLAAVVLPALAVPATVPATAGATPQTAPVHPHRASASRRLAQVH